MANVFREVTTAELLFLAVLSITWLLAATSTHAAEGKEKPAGDGTTASESVEPDLVWRQSLNSHYSARSLEKLIANENILGSVTFPERNM
ncbi:MAG: hypothetical protein QGI83_17755, partial [Candidatus Latescibacteria bacterium]|nr:hypothetical protein [Candidatus Latescibacterota bacterium]